MWDFEVLSWSALVFIVPIVSLLRFASMVRTPKAMTDIAAGESRKTVALIFDVGVSTLYKKFPAGNENQAIELAE